ncbi:DUF5908 family protein [Pseudaquabacterium pictum]|uniref:Uncharacterized protein n=1 Tax=Pseudaquabacterium pictum TaxID=2315236 RepID=A0A480AKM6_9BURK|nr:DUF5908 family protein [Rubrivivax pictus]GCL60927.1 hypothetical protein AQPW35_00080 [Rubrivivax pictus]
MPIQIQELVIRATVQDGATMSSSGPGSDGSGGAPAALSQAQYEQLLQDCVRQVLLVLARERER